MPNPNPSHPIADRRPVTTTVHGDTRVDDYGWLREKTKPEVTTYLEAENAYTASVMASTKPLQDELYKEMLGRIKETDLSVPYRDGEYFYYSRTEEGKQYSIYCRKALTPDAPEQVTLDLNVLAEGHPYMAIGAYSASDDGRLLAYSTDTTGFRQYTLQVKDLQSGELLPERVERTVSVAWAADSGTLYYVTEDDAKRPNQLHRHVLGETAHDLVYEEHDELFRIGIERSRSREYLFLHASSHTADEVRYLRADGSQSDWALIAERRTDREYSAGHHGDDFYILTNDTGRNFRLVKAPVRDPRPENWIEVLPHRPDVMLGGLVLFAGYSVLVEREAGLPRLRVTTLATGEWHRIEFPEPAYSASPGNNRTWDTNLFRYNYQSLVTPNSVFDYDMDTRAATLLKQTEVLGGYDPAQHVSERITVAARDGAQVPVSLVYRKGTPRDGTAPMHLSAYGSYGLPRDASFNSNRVSLLDRGVVVAIAHIRGGGDLGKPWHDAGRMANKMNTFTDFIDVAESLIKLGYTSSERLVIEGGSAGGLLMGAVVNMRPELFRAVIAQVPFVDVLNTMLDASLPLTVTEYEEWGNPNVEAEYRWMRAYCPYSNLESKQYPAMLVKVSFNDSQVGYWEGAKYVARLRALKADANRVLLKANMAAGHGGSSGRYDYLHEAAFDYAYLLKEAGAAS